MCMAEYSPVEGDTGCSISLGQSTIMYSHSLRLPSEGMKAKNPS